MIEITEFRPDYLAQAAAIFIQNYQELLREVPVLPDEMAKPAVVIRKLEGFFSKCPGTAALQAGRLAGYLGWYLVPNFRETSRKAAYCPEWGHAALAGAKAPVYRALYRAASAQWAASGCQTHALTLLANDAEAEKTWYWNGFGLLLVDAVRSLAPIGAAKADLHVRKAEFNDAGTLAVLENEHWRHYAQAPIFMAANSASSAAEFVELMNNPRNSVWLALDGDEPAGYLRFESSSSGAADIVNSETTTAITGAYVRPDFRGRGATPAMLEAALREYAAHGFERCAVDFETFNPEAAAFWPRYFQPVCYSLSRVPENVI
jgi:GNAT superfamily N-acetyltransferase